MGRKLQELSKSLFLAINAKGGENIKPKGKGPSPKQKEPHHQFQNFQNKALIDIIFISIYVMTIYQLISLS
jgi:hypothetical protein